MSVYVIEPVEHDGTQGLIKLESDITNNFSLAIQELQHGATRNEAMLAAAKAGLADPRCNGMHASPYPVDEKGDTVTDPKSQTIHRYRIDISVTRKLV